MIPKHRSGRAGLIFCLLALLLSSCAPASPTPTVAVPTATLPVPTVTPLPVATPKPTAAPAVADAIIIGLLQDREPDTLWPLGTPTGDQRIVQAAVMEPPMTTVDNSRERTAIRWSWRSWLCGVCTWVPRPVFTKKYSGKQTKCGL